MGNGILLRRENRRSFQPPEFPALGTSLEQCSWQQISNIAQSGRGYEFFNIGDTKTVIINGKETPVRIIGINHEQDRNFNFIPSITFETVELWGKINLTKKFDYGIGGIHHRYCPNEVGDGGFSAFSWLVQDLNNEYIDPYLIYSGKYAYGHTVNYSIWGGDPTYQEPKEWLNVGYSYFILSADEYGFYSEPEGAVINYPYSGYVYEYYELHPESRIKYYNNTAQEYLTRSYKDTRSSSSIIESSPYPEDIGTVITSTQDNLYKINKNGELTYNKYYTGYHETGYASLAFCV